jgi:hypothetical protein
MREVAANTGELPHEFLLRVSRGEAIAMPGQKKPHYPTFEERVQAADRAAPFYAPRLSAVGLKASVGPSNPWVELLEIVNGSRRKPPGYQKP